MAKTAGCPRFLAMIHFIHKLNPVFLELDRVRFQKFLVFCVQTAHHNVYPV